MILMLENQNRETMLMRQLLEEENYIVHHYSDGLAAYDSLKNNLFNLFWINLDAGGDMLGGIELLQLLKRSFPRTPALVTGNDQSRRGVIRAYEMGCDEFIKAPVYPEELLFRARHLLGWRSSIRLPGGLTYYTNDRRLMGEDGEILLTGTEQKLFHLLVENLGRVVPAEVVDEMLWEEYASDACRHTLLSRVRKKLGKDLIRTLPKVGYVLDTGGEREN